MEAVDSFTFLRKIPLFADLPDSDLERICQQSEEIHLAEGDMLFTEGSLGEHAYVIMDGQIEIFKVSNRKRVQLAVRQAGEVIGEMAILEAVPRNASGRAAVMSHLLAIGNQAFNHMLDKNPRAVRTLLHTVTQRLQSTELLLRQSEKMAQLGTLTAGIAHELNNPSAAVQRGAERVKEQWGELQRVWLDLNALRLSAEQVEGLKTIGAGLEGRGPEEQPLDALERSDREGELESWLEEAGVENGWELAPALVELGWQPADLEPFAKLFPGASLSLFLSWAAANFAVYRLMDEVSEGAGRMSEIVKALKTYVYLDQGPVQAVDLREGLENTLVILRFKLKQGVAVRREYAPDLPTIEAYGSELNQVWTNIIDNAIDAMEGKGEIVLRTRYQEPWVTVEIEDNGPGIPAEVLPKIFDPFFTTKAVGKGTGLGLNTSYNIVHKHNGEIQVSSRPGETRFTVRLPRHRKALESAEGKPG